MEVTMTIHNEGYRWAEPGKVASAVCKVCGAGCRIDRNVFGPTNHASAIGGLKHLHDHIWCPNAGAEWHNQAVELRREIALTPSPTLAAILRSDLKTILVARATPNP
jgi:hypothetical protein